jgi:hypothetical protein
MNIPRFVFLVVTAFVLYIPGRAQIIIDQTDMPSEGDTLRVSVTNIIPVDFTKTGRDTTWNFNMLEPLSQRVDTFLNMSATPLEYRFIFIPELVANLASPRAGGSFFPGVPVSDYFNFYKKSATAFSDVGFAFKIQGIPVPAKYDNPDKYYILPLDTSENWSSASEFSISIPGMFYFSFQRSRSSFTDGWGSLITPFGTFETIRVRSDVIEHDSVYIDSLGFGFGVDRNFTEYKWLGKGQGIPLLQINSEGLVSTALYRDSVRASVTTLTVTLGPDTSVAKGAILTLTPTVSGGVPPFNYFWSTFDTTESIMVTMDTTTWFGIVVIDALNTFGSDQKLVTVVSPAIEETRHFALEIFPNPSSGSIRVNLPPGVTRGVLSLTDISGREIKNHQFETGARMLPLDLTGHPPGFYMIRITSQEKTFTGRIVLQ